MKKKLKESFSFIKKSSHVVWLPIFMLGAFLIFNTEGAGSSVSAIQEKSVWESVEKNARLSDSEKLYLPKTIGDVTPEVGASSFIILDRDTFQPILEKNSTQKMPIASITKLMTVILALESGDTSREVRINQGFGETPPWKMGLFWGEEISLGNLIDAAVISSANDAGEAIAYHLGKGSYAKFVNLMNMKAKSIGMRNTNFTNAIGLDHPSNYSTAYDLSLLAVYASYNSELMDTVSIKEKKVDSIDGRTIHYLQSTNQLLDDKDIDFVGMKTGSTPMAGGCLVSLAKTKNGHRIITVVLNSSDRFGDTKKLVQWAEGNVEWR